MLNRGITFNIIYQSLKKSISFLSFVMIMRLKIFKVLRFEFY